MLTYKKSGVDIKRADSLKQKIAAKLRTQASAQLLKGIGGFGSLFEFPRGKYKQPVLAASCDGVGTKLKIAVLAKRHDSVGIDAVAMNVNDLLCLGAEPLFFLDYIAYSKLSEDTLLQVIEGLKRGCLQANCSLVGGEMAQMPGMYASGEYDIAGFCLGAVDKDRIIDGSRIAAGDALVGIESNGLHSNGFSLVRKVFSKNELKRYAAELLKPTRIYVKPVLSLLRSAVSDKRLAIKGIAHITGGAFYDKIARILPAGTSARIHKGSWPMPQIFRLVQNKGRVAECEMFHTFNMGLGLVLVVPASAAESIKAYLAKFNLNSWVVGEIIPGAKEVEIV